MKKILAVVFMLFLTGCSFIEQASCEHIYEETIVDSTCTNEGSITQICSKCQDIKVSSISKKEHSYSEWEVLITPTEFNDGFQRRTCLNCNLKEEKIIPTVNYIELDVFRYNYQEDKIYAVNNYNELLILFDCALLNLSENLSCQLNFEYDDIIDLLKKLMEDSSITFHYVITPTTKNEVLSLKIEYDLFSGLTTPGVKYTQYPSGNYVATSSSRDANYEDFAINDSMYQYEVTTSEQLFYVLERNVTPICVNESKAETIYKKIKEVLREIIDDSMTEVEKVRAIHDWLIMNVTYDAQLYDIILTGKDVSDYNSFYLEGVFLDNKAVCEGIAKAFSAMANMEGIPCILVEGYQTNNPSGFGHAWNKVKLDGKYYNVDPTWNTHGYKYFLFKDLPERIINDVDKLYDFPCNEDYKQ